MAVERRDELRSWLADRGIKTIVQWAGTPVHHFEALGYGIEKFTDLPKWTGFSKDASCYRFIWRYLVMMWIT